MPEVFAVAGLIGRRWREWGDADGPFGTALSGEDPIPGTAGRRQRFERGEMVWAPEQDMLVSAFRLRNDVCLQWSIPHVDHEYFRCNAFFDGLPQGLNRDITLKPIGPVSDMQIWLRLQGFGAYDFHVASFDDDDHTAQGWTVPVHIALGRIPGLEPPPFPVDAAMVERWHELGASEGPMGQPTSVAEQFATPESTATAQNFEHGQVITHFALGADFAMSGHQVGDTIEVNWGGFTRPYDRFRVDVTRNGINFQQSLIEEVGLEWARRGRGSGRFRFTPPFGDANYSFVVNPGLGSLIGPGSPLFQATAPVTVRYKQPVPDARLDPLPPDGSPEYAFASHAVRATAIARHFVTTRRMAGPTGIADENSSIQLIAHLHMLAADPDFRIPGEFPHRLVLNTLLRSSTQGTGAMGTSFHELLISGFILSRGGDYDMALKGLMVVLYRYRSLLNAEQFDFIVRDLIPPRLPGPIDPGFESYWLLTEKAPETENHLLMMNSSKYLINRILFERTGDARYDNATNGVCTWLLNFMANFARHDFMEFNARPYQRLSLHVLLNLHEFGDTTLRTAAQIVLDYIMTKFAISSSRGRRVPPFRRMKEYTNKPDSEGNELAGHNVDEVTNLFLTYVGPTTPERKPWEWFLSGWTFNGVIAGLAAYRPPPAAYIIALTAHEPAQHRFYHGNRPMMTEADEQAEGGVELYYSSPSFLLSAGGMFLNSGYGLDQLHKYKQVAVAQSTTLIPVRADATFAELIRFDPYPGDKDADGDAQLQRDAVNTGVHLCFACGANLEVPDRWRLMAAASWDGPWLLLNLNAESLGPAHHQPDRRLGFYISVYRTPVADPERLRVNYGTVPRYFGWLYAMEATAMPFETFADRIRSRNRFPLKLDWDAKYTFITPDEPAQAFEFWMRPDQFKYVPRIFRVDGTPVLVDGFASLPLVDGPYLQSLGHEGRLEIRGPGQNPTSASLVLDYRQPLNPIRTDNADSWPQPHLDRARAVVDFARRLLTMTPSHPSDAVATLRGFEPPAQAQLAHSQLFAQALHTLTRQHFTDSRLDRAGVTARETITAYWQLAATPGADLAGDASSLLAFSSELDTVGLTAESAAAIQTAAGILREFESLAPDLLAHRGVLAQALHLLTRRHIADGNVEQARASARETIQAHRQIAATSGADLARVASNLLVFSSELDIAGLHGEATAAAHAAAEVHS